MVVAHWSTSMATMHEGILCAKQMHVYVVHAEAMHAAGMHVIGCIACRRNACRKEWVSFTCKVASAYQSMVV